MSESSPGFNEAKHTVGLGAGEGYCGFYAVFQFDPEGNIQSHGIRE
jgi:hypothetical protein